MTSYTGCWIYGKSVMDRHKLSWERSWKEFVELTTKLKNSGYDLTQIHLVCEDGRGKNDWKRVSEVSKQDDEW